MKTCCIPFLLLGSLGYFEVDRAEAWSVGSDSTAATPASGAAEPSANAAPDVTPTKADSVAFRSVSRRVGLRASARVFARNDTVEVLGTDVTVHGIRLQAAPHDGSAPEAPVVPWSDVQRVQSRGSAAGRGALIGAIVFGSLGFAAELGSTDECDEFLELDCGADAGDVAGVTLGSAAVGALVGAVVGAPFRRWKDIDLDGTGGGVFNNSRRGFTMEFGAGVAVSPRPETNAANDGELLLGGITRFRIGVGLTDRWAIAYVNDVDWSGDLTGLTGLGVTTFLDPRAPSWAFEMVAGIATTGEPGEDPAETSFGLQAGAGFEFTRRWLARLTVSRGWFDEIENRTVVAASLSRLWY